VIAWQIPIERPAVVVSERPGVFVGRRTDGEPGLPELVQRSTDSLSPLTFR